MFNFPVEKNIIRFYKYKFLGNEDNPLVIEAYNRQQARVLLRQFINENKEYHNVAIISETLSLPIIGETTKKINGVDYVWIGNGWIPLWDYKQRENLD